MSNYSTAPNVLLRVQYACYLFFGLFISIVVRNALGALLEHIPILQKGCESLSTGSNKFCIAEVLVYRISFTLSLFFLMHLITVSDITCCIDDESRVEFQRRFFFAKTIFLVLTFFATLWIPNSFFAYYAYLCIFGSALFLMFNIVLLVDFSYQWSDEWAERAERHPKWMWYLISLTLASYTGGIVFSTLSFIYFVPNSDCNYNAFAILSTVVSALVYTVLSVWIPHGSVVPSGVVFLYSGFIMFTALRTDKHCNTMSTDDGNTTSFKQMLLASIANCFTLGYSVVSAGGSGKAVGLLTGNEDGDEEPEYSGHISHYMFFYVIMILGSMYLAMLATDWHVSGAGKDTMKHSMNIAFWVRSSTAWMSILLYVWSLVAPYVCPDRDFGLSVNC
uniref:Serine incorporator, putative n=1 Tax=Trypanosoma vivax (strain Y486) TaxID=1055687 RepID=G0UBK3_TRYVY